VGGKIEAIDGARQIEITVRIERRDELVGLQVQVVLDGEFGRKVCAAR
jgi:hypothetical protein